MLRFMPQILNLDPCSLARSIKGISGVINTCSFVLVFSGLQSFVHMDRPTVQLQQCAHDQMLYTMLSMRGSLAFVFIFSVAAPAVSNEPSVNSRTASILGLFKSVIKLKLNCSLQHTRHLGRFSAIRALLIYACDYGAISICFCIQIRLTDSYVYLVFFWNVSLFRKKCLPKHFANTFKLVVYVTGISNHCLKTDQCGLIIWLNRGLLPLQDTSFVRSWVSRHQDTGR